MLWDRASALWMAAVTARGYSIRKSSHGGL